MTNRTYRGSKASREASRIKNLGKKPESRSNYYTTSIRKTPPLPGGLVDEISVPGDFAEVASAKEVGAVYNNSDDFIDSLEGFNSPGFWSRTGQHFKDVGDKTYRFFKGLPYQEMGRLAVGAGTGFANAITGPLGSVVGGATAAAGEMMEEKNKRDFTNESRLYDKNLAEDSVSIGNEALRRGGFDPNVYGPYNTGVGSGENFGPSNVAGAGASSALRQAEFRQHLEKTKAEIGSIKSSTDLNVWNAYKARADAAYSTSSAKAVNQQIKDQALRSSLETKRMIASQPVWDHRNKVDKSKFGKSADWVRKAGDFIPSINLFGGFGSKR